MSEAPLTWVRLLSTTTLIPTEVTTIPTLTVGHLLTLFLVGGSTDSAQAPHPTAAPVTTALLRVARISGCTHDNSGHRSEGVVGDLGLDR